MLSPNAALVFAIHGMMLPTGQKTVISPFRVIWLPCSVFAQELSRTFKDKVRIWEFWNEQDIGFALDGAWDYAAAMKAAYLGFKAGNPDTLVASGGLSKTDLINYSHVMMQNGLKDYFDIFNLTLMLE